MGTLTITGSNFEVYGTDAARAIYFKASFSAAVTAFNALTADQKNQCHVAATRMLDRQRWQGTPVGTPVTDAILEWPRNGVVDRYGNTVSSASVPDDIITATYELAALIAENEAIQGNATSGSNIASVGAGPASVSFFKPTLGITGRFETRIQELVGQYLEGSASVPGEAFGADEDETASQSAFDDDDAYGLDSSI
jgi:hypothetical protein